MLKVLMTINHIDKKSLEWGNWKGMLDDIKMENPDMKWELVEDDVVIVSLTGQDIIDEFKTVYHREPTEREYDYIRYIFTDKFNTHWARESFQSNVHDAIDYGIDEGELPTLPPSIERIKEGVEHLTKIAEKFKDMKSANTRQEEIECDMYFASTKALRFIEDKYGIRFDRERAWN